MQKSESLCWKCANAVPDYSGRGCRWSRKLKPVDWWVAEWVDKNSQTSTWRVIECPEYEPDNGGWNLDMTAEERVQDLANAIIVSAASSYKSLCAAEVRIRKQHPAWQILRRLYGKKYGNIYGYGYWGVDGKMHVQERFFHGEYAKSLTKANPVWIMNQIRAEYGLEERT